MADEARYLYIKLGMRGYEKIFKILTSDDVINSKVTIDDAKRLLYIYGRELAYLKGNDTRRKPLSINNIQRIKLPRFIIDCHMVVPLSTYYMIV